MKTKFTSIALSLIIFCLAFQSCKEESPITLKEQSLNTIATIKTTQEKINPPVKLVKFVAPNGKSYLVSQSDFGKLQKIKNTASFLRGIVTYTVSGSLSQIGTNVKIFIGGFSQYPEANYFCNTYKSSASATVAAGSYVLFDTNTSASVPGRTSIYVSTSGTGSVMNQYGTTYEFNTYSVVPVYNMIGQAVSQYTLPQNLTGNSFTYSVYTP